MPHWNDVAKKEYCDDFRRKVSDSLKFLGCDLQGINEHEISPPVKIEFHYGLTLFIDIEDNIIKVSIEIEKAGSIEYLKDIFNEGCTIDEGDENFLITQELIEIDEINPEELACALISIKKKAMFFLK